MRTTKRPPVTVGQMLVTEFWLNIQRAVELRDFCHRAYEHEVRNVRRVKLHTFPLKQA
ncbi:hypothetical protein [Marinobacter sediminicola]|uniref:hypothetical protein n=1 Tax=Marinobacter sediminicola TaxID=3072994 RepID=UPI002810DE58|nr:hypothetical protein [Marinobacter sp. F26243]